MSELNTIIVKGVKEHNLKNVDVELPKKKFIVFSGVSGSGKSSLAFDTIFAEGQRRYVESLSAYARQFLGQMEKPKYDSISGLSPAIAIEQKSASKNPRSTVGTITEIYDYLRVLFARIGQQFCYKCDKIVGQSEASQVVAELMRMPEGTKFIILAPLVENRKGEHRDILQQILAKGFLRARVNGVIQPIEEIGTLAKNKKHSIDAVVDRLVLKKTEEFRKRLHDSCETAFKMGQGYMSIQPIGKRDQLFSQHRSCCGVSYPKLDPPLFSFNSPLGMCQDCNGLGDYYTVDEDDQYVATVICESCKGKRLKPVILAVKIAGKSIFDLTELNILDAFNFFDTLSLNDRESHIGAELLKEIKNRLRFLVNVGLEYLSLNRKGPTLSGGEAQRIRLASQIGSELTGVLYVLDEPSIGLHQKDNDKLLDTLCRLRDIGNTLIVIEHDRDTMNLCDYIVDIGPGAGTEGGQIIACGTPSEIKKNPKSITGLYLSGKKTIEHPGEIRSFAKDRFLTIHEASQNNLKNISVKIPVGLFTCVTGVSGAGKSTLINQILYPALDRILNKTERDVGAHKKITGAQFFDKVINIDQKPIGRTPRSNPATYTKLFDLIRDLFASLPEAKLRGYQKGRFSFNVKGGRCETCQGDGQIKVEMHFLPDVYVQCEQCQGKRFNQATLDVLFKNKSIADILDSSIDEVYPLFQNYPAITKILDTLVEVGLGYIRLGQAATTLSGGEAQRIKLAKELARRDTGKTLYILDEPTTGLHFQDIDRLLKVLHRLVDLGNTIVVIEHNLDVIKTCDWIIDIGPDGGSKGGNIVYQGVLDGITKIKESYTGKYLKKMC